MQKIYHLVLRNAWESNPEQPYTAESLATEGFIHCSYARQVEWAANRFYQGQKDLLVLHLDPGRLSSPLREEASGPGEVFPHIYGPINRDAVLEVEPLRQGADGRWVFAG
jgi:uncharacterized protein (DUF952 family)